MTTFDDASAPEFRNATRADRAKEWAWTFFLVGVSAAFVLVGVTFVRPGFLMGAVVLILLAIFLAGALALLPISTMRFDAEGLSIVTGTSSELIRWADVTRVEWFYVDQYGSAVPTVTLHRGARQVSLPATRFRSMKEGLQFISRHLPAAVTSGEYHCRLCAASFTDEVSSLFHVIDEHGISFAECWTVVEGTPPQRSSLRRG